MRLKNSLVFLCFLFSYMQGMATDFAHMSWPMYQRDASHTAYVDVNLDPQSIKFDWQVQIGDTWYEERYTANLVTANDLIYAINKSHQGPTLIAFSVKDGHIVWQQSIDGGSSMPAVADEKVYVIVRYYSVPNTFVDNTMIYAYDAKTGNLAYKIPLAGNNSNLFIPTLFDGQLYTSTDTEDRKLGALINSANVNTKKLNWTFTTQSTNYNTQTPAVNHRYVAVYSDFDQMHPGREAHTTILDRLSGEVVSDIQDPFPDYQDFYAHLTPMFIDEDKVLVLQGGYLSLIDVERKNVVWKKKGFRTGQPAYDGKAIYLSQNNGLVAIDKITGAPLWKWFKDSETVMSTVVATRNLVFVTTDKRVYAISKNTHKEVWSYLATGQLVLSMGHLYVRDDSFDKNNLSSFSVSELGNKDNHM